MLIVTILHCIRRDLRPCIDPVQLALRREGGILQQELMLEGIKSSRKRKGKGNCKGKGKRGKPKAENPKKKKKTKKEPFSLPPPTPGEIAAADGFVAFVRSFLKMNLPCTNRSSGHQAQVFPFCFGLSAVSAKLRAGGAIVVSKPMQTTITMFDKAIAKVCLGVGDGDLRRVQGKNPLPKSIAMPTISVCFDKEKLRGIRLVFKQKKFVEFVEKEVEGAREEGNGFEDGDQEEGMCGSGQECCSEFAESEQVLFYSKVREVFLCVPCRGDNPGAMVENKQEQLERSGRERVETHIATVSIHLDWMKQG
jgi:hypothetical protein